MEISKEGLGEFNMKKEKTLSEELGTPNPETQKKRSMQEKTLDEKTIKNGTQIPTIYVKEFIKKLKEEFFESDDELIYTKKVIFKAINKLAGKNLI